MTLQANPSAGALALNDPVFTLYRTNVANIAAWTSAHFAGHEGLCVPQIIRFNGNGYYGGAAPSPVPRVSRRSRRTTPPGW